jgi:A/G-specific adenine glycosylase
LRDQKASKLLTWYDQHCRVMPWRVGPADRQLGVWPNPYHVWLSEVMLQQTTVAAVRDYFRVFIAKWPSIQDLANAPDEDVMAAWAGLGYYARARNLLACARLVANEFGGEFPRSRDALLKLPGIGPYTAAAIAAIAFDQPETVVDGNVERVMARVFAVTEPMPGSKKAIWQHAESITPQSRPGDYAQAVMDLGATICTPRSPACGICPLIEHCEARRLGIAADLPRKMPKMPKPVRQGFIYVGRDLQGAWLMERRPPRGLLGGTLGWPGSEWTEIAPEPAPPVDGDWKEMGVEVRHTFTHFHLILRVNVSLVDSKPNSEACLWVDKTDFDPNSLPTLMRKTHQIAQTWDGWDCIEPKHR